jgi:hypothetical protein
MQAFSNLEEDIRQARHWISEAEALSESCEGADPFELYRVSWQDPLVRNRLLVFHRGLSLVPWLKYALNGGLKEQPERWCGGLLCRWKNYRYAPNFYKYVLEPRFRSDPADFLWIIETAHAREREPDKQIRLIGLLSRFLNELVLTAEELAGQYTYKNYGPTNESDKNYWRVRQDAFNAFGLDRRGRDFAQAVLPRLDEVLAILVEDIGA